MYNVSLDQILYNNAFSQHVALSEKHSARTTCHRSLITKPRHISQHRTHLHTLQFMYLSKTLSRKKLMQQKQTQILLLSCLGLRSHKNNISYILSFYVSPAKKFSCREELLQIRDAHCLINYLGFFDPQHNLEGKTHATDFD